MSSGSRAANCEALKARSWAELKAICEGASAAIWARLSEVTCLVESCESWVEEKSEMPVVVKAATCVPASAAMSARVRDWIVSRDRLAICATL